MGTPRGRVSRARTRGDTEGFARRDRLSGTGDADCERAGELQPGRGGSSASRDGEKGSCSDGTAAGSFYERRVGVGTQEGAGGRDLRADGEVLGVRIQ